MFSGKISIRDRFVPGAVTLGERGGCAVNNKLVLQIKEKMEQKTTDELLAIWTKNDQSEWSEEAFAAIGQVLREREVSVAEQDLPPDVPHEQEAGGSSMGDVALDENEHIFASLVPDNPEQLYKHKNQVAAITNKRLLFSRYTGISSSFEGSYTIVSIDIRDVHRVRHVTRFSIGGLLVGLILLGIGIWVAYEGATLQLIGPGVVFIPLVAIPSGIALIFGLKRRVLLFDTPTARYRWISDPLAFRRTKEVAASVCGYFDAPRHDDVSGTESWLTEQSPVLVSGDLVLWHHYVFLILLPYVAVFWGIVNLIRGKKRSGLLLFLGSLIWIVVINVLIFLIASSQGL